jgi:dihydropteroate synthase
MTAITGHAGATRRWRLARRQLDCGASPLIMGIINVTPDSFSDGGQFFEAGKAVEHGLRLVSEGADLLDIGGESTRPGALPVALDEELRRVLPVIKRLAGQIKVPISIDTSKAAVAHAALEAGAEIVNDVTALSGDPAMAGTVATASAGVILMHMRGDPQTMQIAPQYQNVVSEVVQYLSERMAWAADQGVAVERTVIDPGIGFGKTSEHNVALLSHLVDFQHLGRPLCLGVSRKRFLAKLATPQRLESERLAGSLAVACFTAIEGTAQILRVHDVRDTHDAVRVCRALMSKRT